MNHLKIFYLKFREYFNIVLWALVAFKCGLIIRALDGTGAPIDIGVFSAAIYAIVTVMLFKNVTWLLIKTIWPRFAEYASNEFNADFKQLTPWERHKSFLLFYSFWALLLVVTLKTYL